MINLLLSIENIINENILSLSYRWLGRSVLVSLLRLLIIVGLFFISAMLAFTGSTRILQLALVLPVGIGLVLLFLRWPPLGLLGLVGSIIIPISGPSNSNATMGLAALLLGLWIFDMMVRQRKIWLPSSISTPPALILAVVAALAFGVGQLPWYTFANPAPLGAQLGGLSLFILSAAVFLLAATQIRSIVWLQWMTWLFLIFGAIFNLGRLLPPISTYIQTIFTSQVTGSLFWTWLVTLSFSQAAFNTKLHKGWRIALGGLFLSSLYVVMWQSWAWNSGWVPALASVVGVLWAAAPRLGILTTFLGLIGGITKFQKLSDMIMVGDNSYSLGTRVDAWNIVWKIVKVNPLLGLGPANYYWYTPLFPIRGWAVQFNSHSQYIDLIAQIGLLGLACFIWFFGAIGWLAWKLRSQVPMGFPRAYVYGAFGGVVGTLTAAFFGDWVIPFFYNITLGGFRASMLSWLFLGGLVALEQIYTDKTKLMD
jgi:O-antigen ligase